MKKEARREAFAALGAMVGAGFASGREIDSFFSRYGHWSLLGIAAAVGTTLLLSLGMMRRPGCCGMPEAWSGSWWAAVWRGTFGLLMLTTGGAMLAAGREIVALMLPVWGANVLGAVMTVALAVLIARRGQKGGADVCRILVCLLMAMAGAGFVLPADPAAVMDGGHPYQSLLRGASYAGFNMALAMPGLAGSAAHMSRRERIQCALLLSGMLAVLLAGGNALLLKHAALRGEEMPLIQLMARWGTWGYRLSGACMYLSVLTTAGAALRGVWIQLPDRRVWRMTALVGMLICAAVGFSGLVEQVYPWLGAGCLAMMATAFLRQN